MVRVIELLDHSIGQLEDINMSPEQAKKALEFLQRSDLKGKEVPEFIDVVNALAELANYVEKTDSTE